MEGSWYRSKTNSRYSRDQGIPCTPILLQERNTLFPKSIAMTFLQRYFLDNFQRSFLCSLAAILSLNSMIELSTAIGQEDAIKTAKATDESSEGFQSLCDGKDLTGWEGAVDDYEVVEGSIVCKPNRGGVLFTKKQFADFVVRVEFLIPPGGNNGLAIRYPGKGRASYDAMCELQVLDDDAPKYATLDPRQYHGSIYGIVAAKRGALKPVGQWNEQEVTVVGSRIKVELNGQVIVDADVAPVETYLHDLPHPGKMLTQGHFGFAGHGDPVKFRNIRIKELKPAEQPPVQSAKPSSEKSADESARKK